MSNSRVSGMGRLVISYRKTTALFVLLSLLAATLILPAGWLSFTRTAEAASADLVISQVYGGGGNASATYTNDFIEIFNRGTTTVDFSITPYYVQYAAAASNFTTNKTDITSGILLPGHYFLIQEAAGATASERKARRAI